HLARTDLPSRPRMGPALVAPAGGGGSSDRRATRARAPLGAWPGPNTGRDLGTRATAVDRRHRRGGNPGRDAGRAIGPLRAELCAGGGGGTPGVRRGTSSRGGRLGAAEPDR